MPADAQALYEGIAAAYTRDWAAFMPREVPREILTRRLERFLPRVPFFCTESYAARPIYRNGFLVIEDVLRIGASQPTGVMAILGWFHEAIVRTGISPRGESFTRDLFGALQKIHEQEWQFVIINEVADDALDGPVDGLVRAATAEYHRGVHGDGGVELLYVSPFFASLYIESVDKDSLPTVFAQSERWKVLVVSSGQRHAVEELRSELVVRAPLLTLGEVRAHYILELPNAPLSARYRQRARRLGIWPRLLFDGRLHDL